MRISSRLECIKLSHSLIAGYTYANTFLFTNYLLAKMDESSVPQARGKEHRNKDVIKKKKTTSFTEDEGWPLEIDFQE